MAGSLPDGGQPGPAPAVVADPEQKMRLYESLISSTPDLVYAFDRSYRFTFANKALLAMWNRTLEQSVGKSLLEIGYEPWHAEMHEREIDEVIATGRPIRGEVGFPHATLGWRIYDYIFTPVFGADGEVESIAGTTRDITDIKRAEDHLTLMVNELNHRVKNTLTTIQSIARQTFRGNAAEPRALAAFEARLIALSDVHTLLTRTNWESADLVQVAKAALAPFEPSDPARVTTHGGSVPLSPQVAVALAMAFHELASNAVKYGALAGSQGTIELGWETVGERLRIAWRESAASPVTEPQRRGFGTRLIEHGLARELDGNVDLAFLPSGVVCTIDMAAIQQDRNA